MKSIEDLKQALTAINETAFQGLYFDHRPIQQLITELGPLIDKPDIKPQIDKIQAAMGLFLKTSHLESFQDIQRVSFGAAIPLGHDQMRLIEKKDHFLKLLDLINRYQSRPRIFRRLYRGLLSSYFNYDPEASYAKDAGPDHWQHLQRYLNQHVDHLYTEGINPEWITVLQQHQNLLTNNPCSRYAEALLDGASDAFEEAKRHLGFSETPQLCYAHLKNSVGWNKMNKYILLGATLLVVVLSAPAVGRQELYRWTDPETGQIVTTPTLPPYPIKGKRPGANLPGVDFYNIDLDIASPQVKAAIEKREALKAEEQRKAQERAERQAQREQAEREREQAANNHVARQLREAAEMREKYCTGPLSFGIKLGMTGEQVRACLLDINNGYPNKINTTTVAAGLHEQWIYKMSDKNWYFYFTNGILTTVQQ